MTTVVEFGLELGEDMALNYSLPAVLSTLFLLSLAICQCHFNQIHSDLALSKTMSSRKTPNRLVSNTCCPASPANARIAVHVQIVRLTDKRITLKITAKIAAKRTKPMTSDIIEEENRTSRRTRLLFCIIYLILVISRPSFLR